MKDVLSSGKYDFKASRFLQASVTPSCCLTPDHEEEFCSSWSGGAEFMVFWGDQNSSKQPEHLNDQSITKQFWSSQTWPPGEVGLIYFSSNADMIAELLSESRLAGVMLTEVKTQKCRIFLAVDGKLEPCLFTFTSTFKQTRGLKNGRLDRFSSD